VAREAEGDGRDAVWARGCQIYAGYQAYAHRIDHRAIHVMVLEPSAGG
jgi:F420H(2)-dependent quinone reductase